MIRLDRLGNMHRQNKREVRNETDGQIKLQFIVLEHTSAYKLILSLKGVGGPRYVK